MRTMHRSLLVFLLPCSVLTGAVPAAEDNAMGHFRHGNVFALAAALESLPADAPNRALFEGRVAASMRQAAVADEALNRFIRQPGADRSLCAQAVSILAGLNLREGRYAEAEKDIRLALEQYADAFDADELTGLRQSLSVAAVLALGAPQQTLAIAPSGLTRTRDKVGLSAIDITINGAAKSAVFDTGANFCVASESFAKEVGLAVQSGEVEVAASTGLPVVGHVGLADHLALGGCHFRNVAFLVFRDADLAFPKLDYAIHAIIGFPVIAELGRVQVHSSTKMEIGLPSEKTPVPALALKNLEAMVAVQHAGRVVPFFLDTGAVRTSVTEAFTALFPDVMANTTAATVDSGGAGGVVTATMSEIGRLVIAVGDSEVELKDVRVKPDSTDAGRNYFGVIGADLLFSRGGYEFDLRAMSFRLLPAPAP